MSIKLTEKEIIDVLTKIIMECDGDNLCSIAGYITGGYFQWSDEDNRENWGKETDIYLFTPNENYYNAFGKIEKEK